MCSSFSADSKLHDARDQSLFLRALPSILQLFASSEHSNMHNAYPCRCLRLGWQQIVQSCTKWNSLGRWGPREQDARVILTDLLGFQKNLDPYGPTRKRKARLHCFREFWITTLEQRVLITDTLETLCRSSGSSYSSVSW